MEADNRVLKVLIVDDDVNVRDTLLQLLETKGFLVAGAENGREALKKVCQDKPHLIILDVGMPVMDGIETFRRLRESTDTQDIPVIFLSGRVDAADCIPDSSGGAKEYINKPCDIAYLISRINALLAG